jgi:hypothetical protein
MGLVLQPIWNDPAGTLQTSLPFPVGDGPHSTRTSPEGRRGADAHAPPRYAVARSTRIRLFVIKVTASITGVSQTGQTSQVKISGNGPAGNDRGLVGQPANLGFDLPVFPGLSSCFQSDCPTCPGS